jgi:hypothetical protein
MNLTLDVILSEHPWWTLLECLLTSLNREYNPAQCTNEKKTIMFSKFITKTLSAWHTYHRACN